MRTGSVTNDKRSANVFPPPIFWKPPKVIMTKSARCSQHVAYLDKERFHTSLIDPDYRPEHRLLARVGGRLAGHVLMTRRRVRIDTVQVPISGLIWLGTVSGISWSWSG